MFNKTTLNVLTLLHVFDWLRNRMEVYKCSINFELSHNFSGEQWIAECSNTM